MNKVEKYKQKTYEDYVDGVFSKIEFLEYKKTYEDKEKEIRLKIETLKNQKEEKNQTNIQHDNWKSKFKNYVDIEELTRNTIVDLITKIVIQKDSSVDVIFKYINPYE